jgi:hypothetical protein
MIRIAMPERWSTRIAQMAADPPAGRVSRHAGLPGADEGGGESRERCRTDPVFIEVPAGSCVFHCGEVWHGSAANTTGDRMRRAIGVHMLPANARFSDRPGGYIYRRYQRTGDPTLDESYFPILWSRFGQRTTWIENYCSSGLRRAA